MGYKNQPRMAKTSEMILQLCIINYNYNYNYNNNNIYIFMSGQT